MTESASQKQSMLEASQSGLGHALKPIPSQGWVTTVGQA